MNKLKLIKEQGREETTLSISPQQQIRNQLLFKWERFWMLEPTGVNPRNCPLEALRFLRTHALLNEVEIGQNTKVADIGCGAGPFHEYLQRRGANIDAIDCSQNALNRLKSSNSLRLYKQALPMTKLEDNVYDLVICTDVIAECDRLDRRLAIAELCRLVKRAGHVVISTPLCTKTEGALELFINLVETEFVIEKAVGSYHALSSKVAKMIKSQHLIEFFETVAKVVLQEKALSHVILLCHRRPLFSS